MGNNSCACSSREQYYSVFKEFFNAMDIKKKTALLYNEKIVDKWDKKKLKNCDELTEFLLSEFLTNSFYPVISRAFLKNALERFTPYLEEFIISLVFLTQPDKGAVKVSFKKLLKHYKPEAIVSNTRSPSTADSSKEIKDGNSFISTTPVPKEKNVYVKRDEMFEILKVYTNFISLFVVPYLGGISKHNDDFIHSMTEEFSEENQNEYINKKLENFGKDSVSVEEFFDLEYASLSDDSLVRNGISFISSQKDSFTFFSKKK